MREPVRRYVYSAAVAIAGVLIAAGILKEDALVTAVLGALPVLLAVPAVEAARRKVVPVADLLEEVYPDDTILNDAEVEEDVTTTEGR